MTFFLDDAQRFAVTARLGGWDLVVDGKVYYCRDLTAAVTYAMEHLRMASPARGVGAVVDALADIQRTIARATELVEVNHLAGSVARAIAAKFSLPDACYAFAGSEAAFRTSPRRREIVTTVKAILEAVDGQGDRGGEDAPLSTPASVD